MLDWLRNIGLAIYTVGHGLFITLRYWLITYKSDRGTFTAEAVITDRVRPGVVAAPSVWWPKLTGDRANANHTTSQAVTDIGGGATFYDNQVDVRVVSG